MIDTNNKTADKPEKKDSISETGFSAGIARVWGGLDYFSRNLSQIISVISVLALTVMILLICYDVLAGKLLNKPFAGFLEVVSLSQLFAMSFAMGITFLAGQHIKIEMLLQYFPKRVQATIKSLINLIGFILFVIIIWQLIVLARSFQVSGQVTDTVMIPLYPFVYATAFAFVPVCLALLYQLGNSICRMVQR